MTALEVGEGGGRLPERVAAVQHDRVRAMTLDEVGQIGAAARRLDLGAAPREQEARDPQEPAVARGDENANRV